MFTRFDLLVCGLVDGGGVCTFFLSLWNVWQWILRVSILKCFFSFLAMRVY